MESERKLKPGILRRDKEGKSNIPHEKKKFTVQWEIFPREMLQDTVKKGALSEVGKVNLKSNGNEALSDESLLKSIGDEALSNDFP